jgi:hypothetical protein
VAEAAWNDSKVTSKFYEASISLSLVNANLDLVVRQRPLRPRTDRSKL